MLDCRTGPLTGLGGDPCSIAGPLRLASEVRDDDTRIADRIGRVRSGVPPGHGGAQALSRLADGKWERRILLNLTEMFHRIPAPGVVRETREPRLGGEGYGPSRTDTRLAFVAVPPRSLGSGEFLFNESGVDHEARSCRWMMGIQRDLRTGVMGPSRKGKEDGKATALGRGCQREGWDIN
jgi:hypothetical protein